jgi:hypothetical protein
LPSETPRGDPAAEVGGPLPERYVTELGEGGVGLEGTAGRFRGCFGGFPVFVLFAPPSDLKRRRPMVGPPSPPFCPPPRVKVGPVAKIRSVGRTVQRFAPAGSGSIYILTNRKHAHTSAAGGAPARRGVCGGREPPRQHWYGYVYDWRAKGERGSNLPQ